VCMDQKMQDTNIRWLHSRCRGLQQTNTAKRIKGVYSDWIQKTRLQSFFDLRTLIRATLSGQAHTENTPHGHGSW
ncbi:hypothetical protein ACJMK2_021864, partial [Sinanodonta woodiana]